MQKQCHDPCGHCCNQNNDQRIHQSLGSRAHIQLGKVNSACDKRKIPEIINSMAQMYPASC